MDHSGAASEAAGYDDDGVPVRTVDRLIKINDDEDISDDRREALLSEEFAKHGIELEFVGK